MRKVSAVYRFFSSSWWAITLLIPAVVAGAERTVVTDDFSAYAEGSEARPNWQPISGHWQVREGVYEQTDFYRTTTLTFLQEPVFADFAFAVRFRIAAEGRGVRAAGMVFRSADSRDFYYVHFDSKNSQVILVRHTATETWHELFRVGRVSLPTEQWHTGRVEAAGPHFKVFLNDQLIGEAEDATFPCGKVGLRVGQGYIAFDDVRVEGIRGTLEKEWQIMPEQPSEWEVPRLKSAERIVAVAGGGYFPVLIQLQDGSLGAVVRGGAPHIGIKGRLDWIHSEDGGRTWSKPAVVVDSRWDDRNPALGQMPDGTIVLGYAEAQTYNEKGEWDTSAGQYHLFFVTSSDGGRTWSDKRPLHQGQLLGGSPFGRILVLPDGTALMPVYGGRDPAYTGPDRAPEVEGTLCGVLRSTDNGRSWGDFSFIAAGHNETSLVRLPEGKLLALMRTEGGAAIAQAESLDDGRTWSQPRQLTKDGQHPPDITLLQSGNLLLTYGNRLEPYGIGAMLSRDLGQTWDYDGRVMLGWTSLNTDCGYPSTVQLADGTIVTMYYSVGTHERPDEELALVVRYREEDIGME